MTKTENEDHGFATFLITGKDLDPEVITELFGITPTKCFKRGDKRTDKKKWSHGYWSLESTSEVISSNPVLHIEWLMNKLEPITSNLANLLVKGEYKAEINCFWLYQGGHSELNFSPQILKKIGDIGIRMYLNLYFDH